MEIWVDQQDIGYTPNGIDFYIETYSYVSARYAEDGAELRLKLLVKQITVDGDSSDWGSIAHQPS